MARRSQGQIRALPSKLCSDNLIVWLAVGFETMRVSHHFQHSCTGVRTPVLWLCGIRGAIKCASQAVVLQFAYIQSIRGTTRRMRSG
jgi:hypothetical protein